MGGVLGEVRMEELEEGEVGAGWGCEGRSRERVVCEVMDGKA